MPSYVLTGRGGAGNTHRLSSPVSSTPALAAPRTSSFSSSAVPRIVSSGVGGAGNMRALDSSSRSSAAQALQLDIDRAAARDRHPVGYAGRGGAGNAYAYGNTTSDDDASLLSASSSAASSVGERARGWAARVSGSFSRS
ncbi:hypothetical protein PWT90_04445 [Aphanocladium album]|nr:hypothetical protein PWT90_04445 [Aphanocladium album]